MPRLKELLEKGKRGWIIRRQHLGSIFKEKPKLSNFERLILDFVNTIRLFDDASRRTIFKSDIVDAVDLDSFIEFFSKRYHISEDKLYRLVEKLVYLGIAEVMITENNRRLLFLG